MAGILLILLASLFNGNFTVPMKFTKKWEWEHSWGMWALWACLILPFIVAYYSVPDLGQAYSNSSVKDISLTLGAGFVWGLSAIAFGIGVAETGVAVGFSIIMGLVITTGTLVPLITKNPETIPTPAGGCILLGLGAMVVGIVLCGRAGNKKDKDQIAQTETSNKSRGAFKRGILMCILAGVFGPMINFSFIFGEPIKNKAIELGANSFWANNTIWFITLLGGFVANGGYCLYLMLKKGTVKKYYEQGCFSHWIMGLLMGVFFTTGILLYGIGTAKIGTLGTSIGWALFQGPTIIVANISGYLTGEWKNTEKKTVRTMFMGVLVILVGIILVALSRVAF